MTQQHAREWSIATTAGAPEWTRSSPALARRAALREWVALRAEENRRHVARIPADDAAARAARESANAWPNVGLRARDSILPDRASLAMPISGVHVLPTFGKGEHVAPYMGDDASVSEYATAEEADAWVWLAHNAMGDRFMARVIRIMTSEADQNGRRVDHSKRDDVASEARQRFVDMVIGWLKANDESFIGPRCQSGECEHDTCQRVYAIRDAEAPDTLGGIVEWGVPRKTRCGACEGCERVRERQSASRASRWSIAGCAAPRITVDWVSPSRALSRAIWRAAADPTLSTSAVYATRAPFMRKVAAEVEQDARLNAQADTDILRNVPDAPADLIRLITATLAITGDAVYSNRGLSPAARTVLALAMGNGDNAEGVRLALGKARQLWPREASEARDDRRQRRAQATRELDAKHLRDVTDAHYERLTRYEARIDAMAPVAQALAPRLGVNVRQLSQARLPASRVTVARDDAREARRTEVAHARRVMALMSLRTRVDARA